MKEIVDLILVTLIFISLLLPMLYCTVKETEEAKEFVREYYAQLERSEHNERNYIFNSNTFKLDS